VGLFNQIKQDIKEDREFTKAVKKEREWPRDPDAVRRRAADERRERDNSRKEKP
jgi:hypothetical protein